MKSTDFCDQALNIAESYNSVYMWGSFGQPVTREFIQAKAAQYPTWYTKKRVSKLLSVSDCGFWAFDCVGLIKAILWGWCGDTHKSRGGAIYPTSQAVKAGACPDTSADGMIKLCRDVSTKFDHIQPGEAVWMKGHIGIYVGGGKVVEATSKWKGKVLVSHLTNIGAAGTYNRRWTKHGKLPWVSYEVEKPVEPVEKPVEEVEEVKYFETLDDIPAGEMREVVRSLVNRGTIKGNGTGLHLSEDMVRMFVFNAREGLYNK